VSKSGFRINGPLVVRSPNWLGDAVMALPAVRNLKTMLAGDPLTVAAPEKLAALWQACPFVDKVVAFREPKNLRVTVRQLRAEGFGSTVLLPNSLRSAAEAMLAGIPQRIGYARGGRRWLLTHAVPAPARNPVRLHQRFYYLDLVAALDGPTDASAPEIRKPAASSGAFEVAASVPAAVRRSESDGYQLHTATGGEPERLKEEVVAPASDARATVAICPGAEYGPAKRWPLENFLAVARHFTVKHKARILLLGAAGDAPLAAELAAKLPEAENLAGKTSLAEFMTALANARLVFCNDSGAMHAASVLNVPTVAIFGSTEPQLTGPLGSRTQVLRHHVPCSPCFLRECPIDFGCMRGVTPEMAIAAGEMILKI
jgi:heptosyltransferase-2